MGLRHNTIRAAASALLIATAVGAGGMTGMTSALAVDPPARVPVTATLVDGTGVPLAGVPLQIGQEHPEGGLAGVQGTTGPDGSFTADLFPWGTADAPASLSIRTPADTHIQVIGNDCSQTWSVTVADQRSVTWAERVPDPLTIVAETALLGEVCGTVATPPPPGRGGSDPGLTPPPTDSLRDSIAGRPDRQGPYLAIGFVVGLLLAAACLTPRPGARRRG